VTTRRQIIVAAEIAADGLDTAQLDPMVAAAERELAEARVTERPEVADRPALADHPVPIAEGDTPMMRWTRDELTKIAAADELEIASARRDGTLRKPVTIWVVRHGDDLYVRSFNGPSAAWFGGSSLWDAKRKRILSGPPELRRHRTRMKIVVSPVRVRVSQFKVATDPGSSEPFILLHRLGQASLCAGVAPAPARDDNR
jgi:Uncharacterized protein conserved in bacteria (DUF2255)